MKTSIVRGVSAAAFLLSTLIGASAFAAAPTVPSTYTQQGRILDSTGAPVTKKVAITFTLYNDPKASAAANVLWTETQNITPDDGYFSAQLGDVTPIPAGKFDGSVLYIGIQVGSDDEMVPREEITSVPYATLAGSVPFTGITGAPSCTVDHQYLRGFATDGTASCAQPTLSCTATAGSAGTTSASATCASGYLTGGGCTTEGALKSGYPTDATTSILCGLAVSQADVIQNDVATPNLGIAGSGGIGIVPHFCPAAYNCVATSAVSVTAYAQCCTVQ